MGGVYHTWSGRYMMLRDGWKSLLNISLVREIFKH